MWITNVPFGPRSASPSFINRLQTTGHFLQRGRLLQHFFLALMTLGTLIAV